MPNVGLDTGQFKVYFNLIRLHLEALMNVINTPTRSAPPRPTPRKERAINAEFEDRAKKLLREAIAERGVTIDELTERLSQIGVEMSSGGVANKISRGGFSAAFFLQCAKALGVRLSVELDGQDETNSEPKGPR